MAEARVDPALLFTRLRLSVPEARSFLFAVTDPARSLETVARGVSEGIGQLGAAVSVLDARHPSPAPRASGNPVPIPNENLYSDPDQLRAFVRAVPGYYIIIGGSVLHDARTLMLASVADAVVLGCWKGSTVRVDLAHAKAEVERAGGTIAGALYFE